MNDVFYNVDYIEYESGQIKNSGKMLIHSTTPISIEDIKDFIRGKINNPKAVITLSSSAIIDEETFYHLGGDPVVPWLKGD